MAKFPIKLPERVGGRFQNQRGRVQSSKRESKASLRTTPSNAVIKGAILRTAPGDIRNIRNRAAVDKYTQLGTTLAAF